VVTKDVAPGSVMVGIPARPTPVDAAEKQRGFVQYGTPCSQTFDPNTQKLELLQCEIRQMQERIAELISERDEARRAARPSPSEADRDSGTAA
jgi:serine O-acetyltransferase